MSIFLWGFLGSCAVEIVQVCAAYEKGRPLPARYAKKGFWIVRVLLALLGGAMACAYWVDNPILAAQIGACTPLLVEKFANRVPADATAEIS